MQDASANEDDKGRQAPLIDPADSSAERMASQNGGKLFAA